MPSKISRGPPSSVGRGTVVALPPPATAAASAAPSSSAGASASPPKPSTGASLTAGAGGGPPGPGPASDANTLLDTIDSFGGARAAASVGSAAAPPPTDAAASSSAAASAPEGGGGPQQPPFDPIDFLNHHFLTESSLVAALPDLRLTVSERIGRLDESISDTIQRQSDLADSTSADVARAKASILALHDRIGLVQSKALLSERAVLEITRDMKRLDYAKRHLSRTITALKRLHMLLHAVQQLRVASGEDRPNGRYHPDYRSAANLIDATRLLLGHFDGYMGSVQRMRDVRDAVGRMRLELREGIVHGFRVVGLGFKAASDKRERELEGKDGGGRKAGGKAGSAAASKKGAAKKEGSDAAGGDEDTLAAPSVAPPMPPAVLADACLVIDALGLPTRREFIDLFCSDHLDAYAELFDPRRSSSDGSDGAGNKDASAPKPSFKIKIPSGSSHGGSSAAAAGAGVFDDDEDSRPAASVNQNPASLDQVDRRYAWYRRTLRDVFDSKFRTVFPRSWNVPHALTSRFLSVTGDHLLLLLAPGRSCRDRDCENVTVLLKALQKTILFEKEMTAWLGREYGVVFVEPGRAEGVDYEDEDEPGVAATGEDGEALEFDEEGRAVAAGSAEGIRIKYERMKRERAEGREEGGGGAKGADATASLYPSAADRAVPAKPLVGVASSSFDRYMGPYISLEEQNMDEQLVESTSDSAVDTRGELPVFTSSTALFVYIKGSVTRCTALTRGRTFHQLYVAFQDTLRKYATVLGGKLPPPVTTTTGVNLGVSINLGAVGAGLPGQGGGGAGGTAGAGAGGGGSGGAGGAAANAMYRIPDGEEVTVCHVIDTCEYCADTVEALEDLIRDKIDEDYKGKIDMSGEQEAFHDVTARSLRVLVSGLEVRTNDALREMSSKNWATMDSVGEESPYVRKVHDSVQPFVATVRGLIPGSYFRNFCDKYAAAFTSGFYSAIVRLKRISEAGTQQLLLDVYNLKTLLLKLPVIEMDKGKSSSSHRAGKGGGGGASPAGATGSAGSTIPPAMYTKMVTRQFGRIEILLKLVGTPPDLLIDVFKAQWEGGSALDLQTVMNLKGMRRAEQAAMLEKFGVDPETAARGAAAGTAGTNIVTEGVQSLQDKTSDVSAKVNSELSQMREKVDNFRKAFR